MVLCLSLDPLFLPVFLMRLSRSPVVPDDPLENGIKGGLRDAPIRDAPGGRVLLHHLKDVRQGGNGTRGIGWESERW